MDLGKVCHTDHCSTTGQSRFLAFDCPHLKGCNHVAHHTPYWYLRKVLWNISFNRRGTRPLHAARGIVSVYLVLYAYSSLAEFWHRKMESSAICTTHQSPCLHTHHRGSALVVHTLKLFKAEVSEGTYYKNTLNYTSST